MTNHEILIRVCMRLIHKYAESKGELDHDARTLTLKGLQRNYPKTVKEIEDEAKEVIKRGEGSAVAEMQEGRGKK